jgi:hypothetical protein
METTSVEVINNHIVVVAVLLEEAISNKIKDSMLLEVEVGVAASTIFNGHRMARQMNHRYRHPRDHGHNKSRHNLRHKTAMKPLQKMMGIHSGHKTRTYRWRIQTQTGSKTRTRGQHRVMINHLQDRLLQKSASP